MDDDAVHDGDDDAVSDYIDEAAPRGASLLEGAQAPSLDPAVVADDDTRAISVAQAAFKGHVYAPLVVPPPVLPTQVLQQPTRAM